MYFLLDIDNEFRNFKDQAKSKSLESLSFALFLDLVV